MPTIQQHIEVAAEPAHVALAWERFITWARTGPDRLLCDELACTDTVRGGLVDFSPAASGGTTVVCRLERPEGGPSTADMRRRLGHDLVVFKDYVERSGPLDSGPTETDRATSAFDSARRGDAPRHTRLSSEGDTTFWRSHFPT